MASFLGIVVEEVREGYARTSLAIRPEYLNAVDRAHGIAVLAAADQALAVASIVAGSALRFRSDISDVTAALPGKDHRRSYFGQPGKGEPLEGGGAGAYGRLVATCEGITYHKRSSLHHRDKRYAGAVLMPPRWEKPHRNGSRQEKMFSMKRSRIIFTVGLCALLSCASFLRKVDAARIKHHEKRDDVLTQDVTQGEMTLKKGERVKLDIITGDDINDLQRAVRVSLGNRRAQWIPSKTILTATGST